MARRLTLLALLACAVVARRLSPSSSDSESLDPLIIWDDTEESFETTPLPRPRTPKPTKVRLKNKAVNKDSISENKSKIVKSTTINIESYTNFLVTKQPPVKVQHNRPDLGSGVQYQWIGGSAPGAYRQTSTRRPTVRTKKPTSTRRPTTVARRTTKPTKSTPSKNKTCPPKKSGWLSEFFNTDKVKKTPKKQAKPGWFIGFISSIYNWITMKTPWFGGGWTKKSKQKQQTTTTTSTTTTAPLTTSTNGWFQTLLDSEEDDGAYVVNEKKKPVKKSLKKNYKGFQLLRAYPDAQWKVREMLDLQEEAQGSDLMWWTSPSLNGSADLLVPPDLLADVKDHMKSSKIDFDVVIWDLQKAITYENPRLSKKQRLELEQLRGHPMTWRRYHRYADILRYLEYLQHHHADLIELVPLGRSSEGLPLVAVKISIPSNETQSAGTKSKDSKKKWQLRSRMKPAVWLEAGAHAREWIAPAVATWILHALVEGEKGLGAELEVLKQADFYIMPVLNPDGYEHSHTHDRLWKKTRSRLQDQSEDYYIGWFPWNWGRSECVGVDADRNWDYHWGEKDSSRDPCAENYAGPHPFSEPETRAVSEFLAEHRGQIKVGAAAEIRQPASGMSHDWAKARANIKFAYHVDLRDSFGPYGFLLPGSQIVSTARETWQAVKAIVDNLSPGS
ncbi:carboxypeptidase A2-like isoform X4 [Leguminivora glycinivorella]|uniref:carboxypeptidase A2-like isoform X4 n=1 Tax=Leguminivora glycinivorella TaxID=1035111 RepID=UPI00200F0FFB|nr:carboxypeptidase A2-like isoform X4 [Leguminivora glycinivorella]